ncbi:hypothetical protein [Flavobacterium sp. M31R6]|uniref:hypothetical protein n=1 Tax=Flavobacterium sp. M31R6 TaxID=2739062 RepID=UPI001569C577|nr:hypothetical protein [Flavobacterium sp. M31R6]QKJ63349.1 hypothetical protein HQN62_09460 [Flavobacterium sp. M31R6]
MILKGIIDRSLGQLCLRGFAPIKELARISKADYTYQRDILDKQQATISNFLETESFLFFPEVILSYKFKTLLKTDNIALNKTPLQYIEIGKNFTVQGKKAGIKFRLPTANSSFDLKIAELSVDDEFLNQLIESNNEPFHRIDGNHRLSAAEATDSSFISNLKIPFCIILGQEFYDENIVEVVTEDSEYFNKSVQVYFHNINTKTIPLTSEENLRGILGSEKHFNNDEIDKIFDNNGSLARELGKRIIPKDFSSIKSILEKNKWALCLSIYKHYVKVSEASESEIDNELLISKVFDALQAINLLYKENKSLKNHQSIEILTSFLYFKSFSSEAKFNFFSKWIINNHLFEAEETTSESIIRIFDKIYQKKNISVFVAMPYWSHQKVNEYNKLFKEALAEIQSKAKSNIVLDLIPIMRFKGASERIDKRLLDCIKKCDVFVADITECNPNVLFEVAYAEGSGKHKLLIKAESDDSVPPFDMDKMQWIPYDKESYYSSIKSILINNISAILIDNFDVHI